MKYIVLHVNFHLWLFDSTLYITFRAVVPNRGTRATSGTRMLSKWHTQSLILMQIARSLPFSGNIFLHLCFLPYQTWPCDIVASWGRHITYCICEKKNSFLNELGKKGSTIQQSLIIISKICWFLLLHPWITTLNN